MADQFLNADACRAYGAGLSLDPADATAEAIGDALDRLLTDGSIRARAGALAAEIAAMPAPSDVVPRLEALATR
jgi:UDP:flavonoid glycosyltransferase YjiC (YdhE family)